VTVRYQFLKDFLSVHVPEFLIRPAYRVYRRRLLSTIKRDHVPQHIGIIMDGNRRLAKTRGLLPEKGHELGFHKAEEVIEWCVQLGIRALTIYAFSTENFKRAEPEVDYLMSIFERKFASVPADERVKENRIKVKALGDRTLLPKNVIQAIEQAEEATKDNDGMTLNICVAYGARSEIVEAIKSFLLDRNGEKIDLDEINVQTIHDKLFTADLPDPDLIIRTGGEMRLSNFLLFQAAYAELFFINTFFPLLREIDFLRIILEFQQRNRRFGK
jgi:tritrans,polycis-undecaprenyl-diphosphate synthase [geranylgeranyl-diphosphate specific]